MKGNFNTSFRFSIRSPAFGLVKVFIPDVIAWLMLLSESFNSFIAFARIGSTFFSLVCATAMICFPFFFVNPLKMFVISTIDLFSKLSSNKVRVSSGS